MANSINQLLGQQPISITPAMNIKSITPSDSVDDVNGPFRGFMVNVAGNIKITTAGGDTVTLAVAASFPYMFSVSRVFATGTTASGIFGII